MKKGREEHGRRGQYGKKRNRKVRSERHRRKKNVCGKKVLKKYRVQVKEDVRRGEGDVTGLRERGKRDGLMVFVKRMRDRQQVVWWGGNGVRREGSIAPESHVSNLTYTLTQIYIQNTGTWH